jgi:hypothetical protein
MNVSAVFYRQTERAFQAEVVKYAALMRWRVYHTHDSRHSPAGFPDLVLCRARHPRPRVVFVELKAERTPVTDDQRAWIEDLRDCGMEAYIFRPSQWEEIEELLR